MRKSIKHILILTTGLLCFVVFSLCSCSNAGNTLKVSSMKGPTSVGIAQMFDTYDVSVMSSADAVVSQIASGDVDIALIPSNVALNVYQKNHNIRMIDINTLGVLFAISQDSSVGSIKDFAGRKVYSIGKGTIPQAVLEDLLAKNGLSVEDISLQYCSEATEVVSYVMQDTNAIGIINEPQATIATSKNPNINKVVDMTADTVTGVTVVTEKYLAEHKSDVDKFIQDHKKSVDWVLQDSDSASEILKKNEVYTSTDNMVESIKNCNIVCLSASEMKSVFVKFATRINLPLPDDGFYYEG